MNENTTASKLQQTSVNRYTKTGDFSTFISIVMKAIASVFAISAGIQIRNTKIKKARELSELLTVIFNELNISFYVYPSDNPTLVMSKVVLSIDIASSYKELSTWNKLKVNYQF